MTKRTRTTLFLACFFLFFMLTPIAIMYPQGYRINFNPTEGGKMITQTGGIFLSAVPKQANIYIDGKLAKKTDFFFGSALIDNLIPKKYQVKVEKEGYSSWEKKLEIKEKEVVEAKNIILFPKGIQWEIFGEATDFCFSPDGKKIELNFSPDSKKIIFSIDNGDVPNTFEAEISQPGEFSPVERENLSPAIETAVAYYDKNCYLDKSGDLIRNGEKITSSPFPVEEEKDYRLEIFKDFIFLTENNKLYKLNPEKKQFEIFFDNLKNLEVSPFGSKIVYFSPHEIWIFFLDNAGEPYNKQRGEKILLARFSENIKQLFWFNENYLIFSTGDSLRIIETDNRDKPNITELANKKDLPGNGSLSKIFWNSFDKKVYILSEGTIFRSESFN